MSNVFYSRLLPYKWLLVSLSTLCISQTAIASDNTAWDEFKKGTVVALMRHALAPGNGDPAEFEIGNCTTQRNLSEDGIAQAKRIGMQFKERGVKQTEIFSSQWCRCIDTGNALDLGTVRELPMLNSFYQDRSTQSAQTEQLKQWIMNRLSAENSDNRNTLPAMLVTHQVNITALTGVFPSSGEIVFVASENGAISVRSTLAIPH